ncbi:hypothetical protein, partial [Pseudomonas syringae group genomosp. 7]|uniref:hypothetical protein n=1 Tax=Pseudomonas syringae group genomosp. 7 TaxID=251699 RepID=UPI0037702D03
IKNVDEKILKMTNIKNCLDDAFFLVQKKEIEIRQKRYKMIFPSSQFKPFSLGDRSNHLPIKINENNDLFNTCHIKIY